MKAKKVKQNESERDFVNGEYYHIYNRGVDKRNIFSDPDDLGRFYESMDEFNCRDPIGSIYQKNFSKRHNQLSGETTKLERLVNIICYCLNPNHYHFIVEQHIDGGISEFMKRLGGYTRYFNEKHERTGALFQGLFKSKHIDTDEYLMHLSVYVNLNFKVHGLDKLGSGVLYQSSWNEYVGNVATNFCTRDVIIARFKNFNSYKKYANETLPLIVDRKENSRELEYSLSGETTK